MLPVGSLSAKCARMPILLLLAAVALLVPIMFKIRHWDVARRRRVSAEGVSHYPCSIVYCGPGPASEPETVVVQGEARRLASQLRGWLTLHSYGRMWMFPYATTLKHEQGSPCQRAPDHYDLVSVARHSRTCSPASSFPSVDRVHSVLEWSLKMLEFGITTSRHLKVLENSIWKQYSITLCLLA